jgi:hypothetical protein
MAVSMKLTTFWNTVQFSLLEVDRRFRGFGVITLMIEAVRTCETLANF